MTTPYEFGAQVGKQAFFLPAVGGVAGAVTAPSGHRMEGLGRGVTQGVGGSVGSAVGVPTGIVGALALSLISPRLGKALFGAHSRQLGNISKKFVNRVRGTGPRPLTPAQRIYGQNLITRGGTAGGIGGGVAGIAGTGALMGKPSWEKPAK
jgi:hypothetical protein